MTGVDVEHTKALEAAATPGPWSPSKYYRTNIVSDSTGQILCQSMNAANREFIAHARTAVPALVAAVERVQALATEWATQPTDYDEDTEQQIEDGKQILAILEALETP